MAEEKDELRAERERVAERLRRVREEVRDRALLEGEASGQPVLPAHREVKQVAASDQEPPGEPSAPPVAQRPDGTAVNQLWEVKPSQQPGGLRGRLGRRLRELLAPTLEAQVAFNSQQVQLDNAILDYIDARLEATHRHYDDVLGRYGRHLGEIDERHMILQEELVAHVHDLVERIDLVLSSAERGRLSLEFALQEIRQRLARLEQRLKNDTE